MPEPCCPCDRLEHPPAPDIPPGLVALPRQWVGFPEYRRAMLAATAGPPPLAAWRIGERGDFGVMLLEMWAYVLDILGFYDARIAEESYLRTAKLATSPPHLIRLLGYRPRPAVSASATLALLAEGADPVTLPRGTAFRSEPFGQEPPQIFETLSESTIWPQRNQWRLAKLREDAFDGRALFAQGRARIAVGQVVVLSEGSDFEAVRVKALSSERALDGATYVRAEVEPPPAFLLGRPVSAITLAALTLAAHANPFAPAAAAPATTTIEITLDGLYPQLRVNGVAAVEVAGALIAAVVADVRIDRVAAPLTTQPERAPRVITLAAAPQPAIPATRVRLTLRRAPPADWATDFLLRFQPIDGGQLTTPAKTRIALSDLLPSAPLEAPVEPLGDAPGPTRLIAQGAETAGAEIAGGVVINAAGNGRLTPDAAAAAFPPLRTPIDLFGNAVDSARGETVAAEVLGSADAAQTFQSFALKKKPLSYVLDPSAPDGIRAELEIRVNGLLWREVPSFFDAGPKDEVYIVLRDDDGTARVVLGDGVRGARPASGVGNVSASYRFGAGAAMPPAGTINQIARPVKGLKTVVNPLPARGGSDGDTPEMLRSAAPRSALTLGCAVSVADFEALARSFPGVVNATASWAFDGRLQRATVKVWIIAAAGDPSADLRAHLRRNADPQVPIVVVPATPQPVALRVALEIDERNEPKAVREAARAALADDKTGLLAPANVEIGRPVFRSAITARLIAVAGVKGATVMLGGALAPTAFSPGEGAYLDISGLLVK
jgi:hypothetical protein